MEKDGNVDCRPYLLVCQRSIANLRGSNKGGCSHTSSNIERIEFDRQLYHLSSGDGAVAQTLEAPFGVFVSL